MFKTWTVIIPLIVFPTSVEWSQEFTDSTAEFAENAERSFLGVSQRPQRFILVRRPHARLFHRAPTREA
jgi:hypothetical protein